MRVNIYNEELTDEVQIVEVHPNNRKFIGIRFMLESSEKLHNKPRDDDRSAVTFWVGDVERGRELLRRALHKLNQS